MNLAPLSGPLTQYRFPRACGDEPLLEARKLRQQRRFPRACGDEPALGTLFAGLWEFSPRLRG